MEYIVKLVPLVALLLLVSGCMSGTQTTTTDTVAPSTVAKNTGNEQQPQQAATTTTQKAQTITDKITNLASAMGAGVGYRCTYTYQGLQSQGWLKGDKYYFESTTAQGTSYALSDGTWMYTWQKGQTKGIKFNIAEMKKISDSQKQGYQDLSSMSSSTNNVNCVPDVSADSKFVPPSGVTFQDMGELLKQIQGMGAGGQAPDLSGYPGQ